MSLLPVGRRVQPSRLDLPVLRKCFPTLLHAHRDEHKRITSAELSTRLCRFCMLSTQGLTNPARPAETLIKGDAVVKEHRRHLIGILGCKPPSEGGDEVIHAQIITTESLGIFVVWGKHSFAFCVTNAVNRARGRNDQCQRGARTCSTTEQTCAGKYMTTGKQVLNPRASVPFQWCM